MKSKLFTGAILGMVLVLGMMVMGCQTTGSGAPANLAGTWKRATATSNYELTFSGNTLTLKENGSTLLDGTTFTNTDTTISFRTDTLSSQTGRCTLSNNNTALTITTSTDGGFGGPRAKLIGEWTK